MTTSATALSGHNIGVVNLVNRLGRALDKGLSWLADLLDRRWLAAWTAFSLVYFGTAVWLASKKPFWYDELVTLNICRLESLHEIWAAFRDAADAMPPLLHLATRASIAMFGENEVAPRLPGILGVWILSASLYHFARRRCRAIHAWVAASSIVLLMLLNQRAIEVRQLAIEARSYGMMMGFLGVALACWGSVGGPGRRWRLAGLALSVAAAVLSHPTALIFVLALGLGELVRAWTLRRCDWPVLVALALGACAVVILLPAAAASAAVYRGSAWSTPRVSQIVTTYILLLDPVVWPFWLASALAAAGWIVARPPQTEPVETSRWGLPAAETTVLLALQLAPAATVLLGFLTGVFWVRYTLPALVGFCLLAAFVSQAMDRARPLLAASMLFFSAVSLCFGLYRAAGSAGRTVDTSWVEVVQREPELPVVVDDALGFLEQVHYAPRDVVPRLVFLADPERARRATGNTSATVGLMRLARWVPLRVEQPDGFLASNPRFYLFGSQWVESWLRRELVASGVHPRLIALGNFGQLYLVALGE